MLITLDTNIFYKYLSLKDTVFKTFLDNYSKCGFKLYISNVVLEETVNQYRELLLDFNFRNKKYYNIISNEFLSEINIDKIDELTKKFKNKLIEILSLSVEDPVLDPIKFIDYKNISHEKILNKAKMKIKPFNNNGKGYQDALIFENILNIFEDIKEKNQKLYFITSNINDFANINNNNNNFYYLHNDLLKDLENIGCKKEDVIIYKDLNLFINDHIIPNLEKIDETQLEIKNTINEDYVKNTINSFQFTNSFGNKLIVEKVLSIDSYDARKYWYDKNDVIVIVIKGIILINYKTDIDVINKNGEFEIFINYDHKKKKFIINSSSVEISY